MSVHITHSDYDAMVDKWERARKVVAGEDDVKAAGQKFVPRLDGQTDAEYLSYLERGLFYNATARTLEGLAGTIFRKDPVITKPEGTAGPARMIEALATDMDMGGTNLLMYAKKVVHDVLAVARCGTMVDWQEIENRPFTALYKAEDIINWRMGRVNGRTELTMVVLAESVPDSEPAKMRAVGETVADDDPEYAESYSERIRVLKLVPLQSSGQQAPVWQYVSEVWSQVANDKKPRKGKGAKPAPKWTLDEVKVPLRAGKPLPFIPFIFHGPMGCNSKPDKLPLEDLIAANLDHFRMTVDYRHGLHFTALPTAWVAGFDTNTKLSIGSTTAWVSSSPDAEAGFLEFTGQGLGAFVQALKDCESYMAILGARLLEEQKKDAETAETLRIRQGGESSVLMNIATSISEAMTRILKIGYWWASTEELPDAISSETINFQLNTDFISAKLSTEDVVNLVAAWQQRGISRETLHWNLEQGEILPPGRTAEEEAALIENEIVPLIGPLDQAQLDAEAKAAKDKAKQGNAAAA